MNQKRILAGAILATSCMTVYSYMVSAWQRRNFREPSLLADLIQRPGLVSSRPACEVLGWKVHYLVGLLFAELYTEIWNKRNNAPRFKDGLVAGGLTGIAAILVWKFTLRMHPSPPPVAFPRFAGQLFIAHVIFGLVYQLYYRERLREISKPVSL